MADEEEEFIIKKPTARHVPEWFKRMSSQVSQFNDQSDRLNKMFVENNSKIEEFNKREKQEKRRQYNEKYGEKLIKYKLKDLPLPILYKIVLFCGN